MGEETRRRLSHLARVRGMALQREVRDDKRTSGARSTSPAQSPAPGPAPRGRDARPGTACRRLRRSPSQPPRRRNKGPPTWQSRPSKSSSPRSSCCSPPPGLDLLQQQPRAGRARGPRPCAREHRGRRLPARRARRGRHAQPGRRAEPGAHPARVRAGFALGRRRAARAGGPREHGRCRPGDRSGDGGRGEEALRGAGLGECPRRADRAPLRGPAVGNGAARRRAADPRAAHPRPRGAHAAPRRDRRRAVTATGYASRSSRSWRSASSQNSTSRPCGRPECS